MSIVPFESISPRRTKAGQIIWRCFIFENLRFFPTNTVLLSSYLVSFIPGGKDDKKKKKEDTGSKILKDKDGNVLKWVDRSPTFNEIANIKVDLKSLLSGKHLSRFEFDVEVQSYLLHCFTIIIRV